MYFLLDVSKSMDALDYRADQQAYSRLEVGKKIIEEIVKKYPENRYWLTIFTWDVSTVIPLAQDSALFLSFLSSVDSASLLWWWNDIMTATKEVIQRFQSEQTTGWIIVLSDFEFPKYFPDQIQRYYEQNLFILPEDVSFFTIGLWSEVWNRIPVWRDGLFGVNYLRDGFQEVITKYDRVSHQTYARIVSWEYFYLKNISDIPKVFWFLWKIPTRDFESQVNHTQSAWRYFALLWYLLFLAYMLKYYFERRKKYNL